MSDPLVRFSKEIVTGLAPSLPMDKIPLWIDGENVVFKEGSVQPIPGQYIMLNKANNTPAQGAIELTVDGYPNLFWGTQTALYRYIQGDDPPDADDVTDPGNPGAVYHGRADAVDEYFATRWSFASWGNWVLAVNGDTGGTQDPPQIWKGSGVFDEWDVDAEFTYAEIVRTLGPYALCFNTDQGRDMVHWSDTDDVETWIPAATNAAGYLPIREMDSPIMCAERLGKGIGIYARDGLWIAEFIGAPFYFAVNHLLDGLGASSKNSIAVVGKLHYGFGPRGIFRTDGISVEYIGDPFIHDYVFQNLNRNQQSKVLVWHDSSLGTVNFSFPSASSLDNDRTVSFSYRDRTWTKFSYARNAATTGSVFPNTVTIDKYGNVYQHSVETFVPSDMGQPMTLTAECELISGYGEGGYGEGGYGGTWNVNG